MVGPGDNLEELKEEVMADMADIFSSVDKGGGSSPPLPAPCSPLPWATNPY